MVGTVKHWNPDRYFGFVVSGGESLFFHGRSVTSDPEDLHTGARVEFERGHTARGPCAMRVEMLPNGEVSHGTL